MLNKIKNKNIYALFFICLATSLFTLDLGIIAISLNEMSNQFSTDRNVTSWIITVFSISSAIGIISLSFLSKSFGRKKVYLFGVLGFSIFSVLCGMSYSFEQIIICRIFQGFFGASLVALSQAFVLDIFNTKYRSKALSAWTFGLLAGPVIGPLLGGLIIEFFNWRLIFFINLPLGILAFIGLGLYLETDKVKNNNKFNLLAFLLLSISSSSIQIFLDRGELKDWFNSYALSFLFLLSVLCLILFIINNKYSSHPLFPRGLFKDRFFIGGAIFAFLFGFILIPPFVLLPIYLSQIQSFPINLVGVILSVSGIGGMLGTFFTSKIIFLLGNIKTLVLGLFIFVISNYHVTTWTADVKTMEIILNTFYRGISISVFYVALANVTYKTLPYQLRTEGASLFQFLRTLGTGFSVAICIAIYNRYKVIHYENLRNHIDLTNFSLYNYFTQDSLYESKIEKITEIIIFNSMMKALITDFFLLSVLPFLFLPFLFLFYKKELFTMWFKSRQ